MLEPAPLLVVFEVAWAAVCTVMDYSINTEPHERAACRLKRLAQKHGGLLCKFGQHVASLDHAVPREYVRVLSCLTDAQPASDVLRVLETELGQQWESHFRFFEKQPVASASVAQVHRAQLKTGEKVAVKVMHPSLRVDSDMAAVKLAFNCAKLVFPDLQDKWGWLLPEFEDALRLEVDLTQEAVNSERCKRLLSEVSVPSVFWHLTTRRVLVAEWVDGYRVDDIQAHQRYNIDSLSVASTLVDSLARLSYEHGLVHADPHRGNVLCQPQGDGRFRLWLLDHGLYRRLDHDSRRQLCRLWVGLATRDFTEVADSAYRLGLGDDVDDALLVARLVFTGRADDAPLGSDIDAASRARVSAQLRDKLPDASLRLQRLPRDLLFTFRASSLLRGQHLTLGGTRRDRYLLFAKAAARGLAVSPDFDRDDDSLDAFPPNVVAALVEPGRLARPRHPLNSPTASERALRSPFLFWRRIKAAFRVAFLLLRLLTVEFFLRLPTPRSLLSTGRASSSRAIVST